ncbi:mCG1041391 [Mus musculus]|nr:mCG1041391 [Mus musculus]
MMLEKELRVLHLDYQAAGRQQDNGPGLTSCSWLLSFRICTFQQFSNSTLAGPPQSHLNQPRKESHQVLP